MTGDRDWRTLLVELHDIESELAELLDAIAARHEDDNPGLREDCARMARRSTTHVVHLAELADGRGLRLDTATDDGSPLSGLRDLAARLLGGQQQIDRLLLDDLRRVHLSASAAALDWRLLGELGRMLPDEELRYAVAECLVGTEQQLAWVEREIMLRGPDVLTGRGKE